MVLSIRMNAGIGVIGIYPDPGGSSHCAETTLFCCRLKMTASGWLKNCHVSKTARHLKWVRRAQIKILLL